MAVVARYTPGARAPSARAGDFILLEDDSWVSRGIRLAQGLRFRGPDSRYTWPNHTGVLVSPDALVEAVSRGVRRSPLSIYDSRDYVLVRVEASDEDREQMARFALSCIGYPYGIVTSISFALTLFVALEASLTVDHTYICSQLVAQALERAGYVLPRSPERMSPADLAKMFDVVRSRLRSGEELRVRPAGEP